MFGRRADSWLCLLGLATVALAGRAAAEPLERGEFRLVWSAPSACPSAAETLARIESLLGGPTRKLVKRPLAARGLVTELPSGDFELTLETFQGTERYTRSMRARSCVELTDAGALVLALSIDPGLGERRRLTTPLADETPPATKPAEASEPPAPPEQPAATSRAPMPRPTARAPSPTPARFSLTAAGVVNFGSVATSAFGPELSLGLELGRIEIGLDAIFLPPRRSYVSPGKGGDIELAAGAARGCYRLVNGRLSLLGCGGFELGEIDGEGVGTLTRTRRRGLWLAPEALVAGRLRLFSWPFVSAGAAGLAPIQPVDFTLENVGAVHRSSAFVVRFSLGLGGHFD